VTQYVPAIGATCLGIVIGYLVRYFIRRFSNFGAGALGSVITIILGGAVIKFLEADRSVWWFYPIGLFLGFAFYQWIATRIVSRGSGDNYGNYEPSSESQGHYIPGPNDPRVDNAGSDTFKKL
jgi:hypothetical protein